MAFVITVDFGAGAVNITSHCSDLKKKETLYNKLKPTVNYAYFTVDDITVANNFLTGPSEMHCVITNGGAAWFEGYIRNNFKVQIGSTLDHLKIEVVDPGMQLRKTIDQSLAYTSFKVCNTANKAASLLHQLFYEAGILDGDLNLTTINYTVTQYCVDPEDEETYWDEIERLCFEFGYVFNFKAGLFVLVDLFPAAVVGVAYDDDDIFHGFQYGKKDRRYEGVRVIWHPNETVTDQLIFSDTTGKTEEFTCVIPIANGEFYPDDSDAEDVYAQYELEGYEIIIVTNAVLNWLGEDVAVNKWTAGNKRALVSFSETAAGGILHQFDIRGNVTAMKLTDIRKSVKRNVVGTEKIDDIEVRYIKDTTWADRLSNGVSDYYEYSDFDYSFETDVATLPGDLIDLTEAVMSVNTDLRVIEVELDEYGNYKVKCEGISAYSVVAVTTENSVIPQGGGGASGIIQPIAPDDAFLIARYSFGEGGGSTGQYIRDDSGNQHPIYITDSVGLSWENAFFGKAPRFDGANSVMSIPYHANFNIGTGDFSVSFRIVLDTLGVAVDVLNRRAEAGTQIGWRCYSAATNILQWVIDHGAAQVQVSADAAFVQDKEYHIALVRRNGVAYIYIDAIQQSDTEISTTTLDDDPIIQIGATKTGVASWTGLIGELAFYSYALTPANILWLKNNPFRPANLFVPTFPSDKGLVAHHTFDDGIIELGKRLRDSSGNGAELEITLATNLAVADGVSGKAINMESDELLTVTNLREDIQAGDVWSWTGWLSVDELASVKGSHNVAWLNDGTWDVVFIQSSGDDKWKLIIYELTTRTQHNCTDSVVTAVDGFHFFGVTFDQTDLSHVRVQLYRDGVLVDEEDFGILVCDGYGDAEPIQYGTLGIHGLHGSIDESRFWNIKLTPENMMALFLYPGGPQGNLALEHKIPYGALGGETAVWGGFADLLINSELLLSTMELFLMEFSCRSSNGLAPVYKDILIEMPELYDSDNADVENVRCKQWTGLTSSPRTPCIGTFRATENLVGAPEDLTDTSYWSAPVSSTVVLTDYWFDGHQFSKVTNTDAVNGYVPQAFAANAFTAANVCLSVMLKRVSGSTTGGFVLRDTIAAANRINIAVAFSTEVITVNVGTLIREEWLIPNQLVRLFILSTAITVANTHELRAYTNSATIAKECSFSAFQIEDVADYPTPYTPVKRLNQSVTFRKLMPNAGTISFYFEPWFSFDVSVNHDLFSWGIDGTHYMALKYQQSNDRFIIVYVNGGTERYLLQTANTYTAGNQPFDQGFIHFKWSWDIGAGTGNFRINGAQVDGAWSAAPDAYDNSFYTFNIGMGIAGTTFANGLFDDFVFDTAIDVTDTHYDNDKPFRDPFATLNYKQGVLIDRYGARYSNFDITLLDVFRRQIDIGSLGLLARDASGLVIHDIPNARLLLAHLYQGHLIWYSDSPGAYPYLLYLTTTITASTWTDITCVVDANTNVKGGRFKVSVQVAYNPAFPTNSYATRIWFRPKGSTWAPGDTTNAPGAKFAQNYGAATLTQHSDMFMTDCPIGDDNKIQFSMSWTGVPIQTYIMVTQMGIEI